MREYSKTVSGHAEDKNGVSHLVTVVGEVKQDTVWEVVNEDIQVQHVKPGSYVDGFIAYPKKKFKRTLTIAYSICHPEDAPSLEIGEKIARDRLKTKPLGIATTENVTMFQKEDLAYLTGAKFDYICENIDKFIEGKKRRN